MVGSRCHGSTRRPSHRRWNPARSVLAVAARRFFAGSRAQSVVLRRRVGGNCSRPGNAPDQCRQETPQCRPRRVADPDRPGPAPPNAPVNVPPSDAVREKACSDAFELSSVEQRHHVQRQDVSLDIGIARCHVVTLGSSDGGLQQGGIARCVEEQLWVGKHICHSPLQWLAFGQRFVPGVVRLGGIRCPPRQLPASAGPPPDGQSPPGQRALRRLGGP